MNGNLMTELEQAQLDYFVCKTMHKRKVRRFLQVKPGPPGQPPKSVTMVSTKTARDTARRKIKALS